MGEGLKMELDTQRGHGVPSSKIFKTQLDNVQEHALAAPALSSNVRLYNLQRSMTTSVVL